MTRLMERFLFVMTISAACFGFYLYGIYRAGCGI